MDNQAYWETPLDNINYAKLYQFRSPSLRRHVQSDRVVIRLVKHTSYGSMTNSIQY